MQQTMAEKVFSRKMRREVFANDYITSPIDKAMCHEGFIMSATKLMVAGIDNVWDPKRVIVFLDHAVPAPTEQMAIAHYHIREMVKKFGINNFRGERDGICHQVMCEKGYVEPGDLIVGTDSHTCTYGALGAAGTGIGTSEMAYVLAKGEIWFQVPQTIRLEITGKLPDKVSAKDVALAIAGRYGTEFAQYRSIEYCGEVARELSISSRLVLSNMSIEYGAKFGFFPVDEKAVSYLQSIGVEGAQEFGPDEDAVYESEYRLDVNDLEPLVALPHSVDNVKSAREMAGTPINQAFLGSCTNGRIEDLRSAAEILNGGKVADSVRLLVYPASRKVLRQAMEEGLIQILVDAGGIINPPSCGACFGNYGGVLAPDEACISSTNRNFKGRMGSSDARVYLASPATVASSALKGVISDPREAL